jgi:signal transduction histidine kinase/CheY-like chemotaxis protein
MGLDLAHVLGEATALAVTAALLALGWIWYRERAVLARDALGRHARRQEALASLGQLAVTAPTPALVLAQAAKLVRDALAVDLVALWEVLEGQAILRAGAGWDQNAVGQLKIPAGPDSSLHHVLSTNETVVVADLGAHPDRHPGTSVRHYAITSAASVAVRGWEQPFGVLAVYTRRRHAFEPSEVAFLEAVSAIVTSTTISRSQADDLEISAALAHVGQELISSLDAPVLVSRLCQLTAETLATEHSTTWLLQPDEQVYVPIAQAGIAPERWEAMRPLTLPVAAIRAFLDRLGREGVVQVHAKSRDYHLLGGMLDHLGVTVMLFAALRRGDDLIGMQASGFGRATAAFTARQERTARGIAHLASMALTNARLVEELERANQLKSEFVSTMSHELRTPLNVIVGYTDMLGDAPAPDEQSAILKKVRHSSIELLEMIEGTLDLNRMATGRDAPRIERVKVQDLFDELRTDFAAIPRRSEAELRWEPADKAVIYTDRRKLKIILKNLVGNALKFTQQGQVAIACARNGVAYEFTVRDTGIGIPREHLAHVFEMFRQVDSSDRRSYGGAGLGLYIVRSLLAQLGGEVSVESEPGKGSTFHVVLPAPEEEVAPLGILAERLEQGPDTGKIVAAARAANPSTPEPGATTPSREAPTTPETPRARRRILFADDLPVSRLLLRRFLTNEFPEVDILEAIDGAQAIAMVEVHRPDLLLLDMRMPEMDGWQVARDLRRLECGREMPIIAMSVNASPGMEGVALAAGCNEFIPKPVSDYHPLIRRLRHWLAVTPARAAGPSDAEHAGRCALCRRPLEPVEPAGLLRTSV